jgi:hypothetical protein
MKFYVVLADDFLLNVKDIIMKATGEWGDGEKAPGYDVPLCDKIAYNPT